jgi:ribonuclease P protein component
MPSTVLHINDRAVDEPSRFGFIVTKSVGNAVTRNLVRRRLRAASRELLPAIGAGKDIVIRALPGSDRAGWATLHTELAEALEREGMRG